MNDENRVHRRRLMLEGAVIVASILLAFSIDALWAQHQLRGEEQEALASLYEDFTENLDAVNWMIEAHLKFREDIATLVRLSPEEIRALPQATVSQLMLATANPWTFDAILGTTDALIGAGKLGVLRNRKLRESLITFLNKYADSLEDIGYITRGAEVVWRAEIKHGGPWTDPATEIGYSWDVQGFEFIPKATAEDLLNVRSDTELMGLIYRQHLNAGYYVSELEGIRDQIQMVLNLIEEST